jgi:hypothetical protein
MPGGGAPAPHPLLLTQNPLLSNAISPPPMAAPSLGSSDDARARLNSLLEALRASAQVK